MEEVHLWRGTPEQRALRSQRRRLGQFAYFDRQLGHPDWTGKTVLDFGGNQGNLLLDSNGRIRPRDYYCVDVIEDAVEEGRGQFPEAHWVHYNRYNCSFNPEGLRDAPIPEMGVAFDFILAFSVFTHTTRDEMRNLVAQLRARLAPGGTLAFSFIDPHDSSWPDPDRGNNLQQRLDAVRGADPAVDLTDLLERSRGVAWCALDGTQLHVNSDGSGGDGAQGLRTYHVFYTAAFMREEFPNATILPPVNGETHHCCVIRRPASLP